MSRSPVFELTDHLDVDWRDELVGFQVGEPLSAAVSVRDELGRELPAQLARNAEGDARVYFVVDELRRLATRRFELISKTESTIGGGVVATRRDGLVELDAGAITIRLPGDMTLGAGRAAVGHAAHTLGAGSVAWPGPIAGVRRAGGAWIGESRLSVNSTVKLDGFRTNILESGPLWTTAQVAYFAGDRVVLSVTIRVFAGRDFVEVREESHLNHDAMWEFDLGGTLAPTVGFTHSLQSRMDLPARVAEVNRGDRVNLGAVTLPNYGGIYVPDDYVFYTLAKPGADRVSVSGIRGGDWLYPAANQIEIDDASTMTGFRFPCKAGGRAWCLGVEAHTGDWKERWYDTLGQRIVRKYDTTLDAVKDMALVWSDGEVARPSVMLAREDFATIRSRAERIPSIREYVGMLDPNANGEWFRYHSGTWGDQKADSPADPPTAFIISGNRRAAVRTKEMILAGVRHRLEWFFSPVGNLNGTSGSYINLGRGIRPWMQFYDLVAGESVFTLEEDRWFRAALAFFAYKIDDRDYFPREALLSHSDHPRSLHRTHWFPSRESDYNYHNIDNLPHNFHQELYGSAIVFALVYPGHPESGRWLSESVDLLDREMTEFVFPCGAWIESATYTFYTFAALLIPPMYALYRAGVRDFFADARFQKAMDFLSRLITAPDPRCGHGGFPPLGDASFPGYFGYVFNWVATLTEHTDRAFAERMMDAWIRYGSQTSPRQCQGLNYLDLLLFNDHIPATPQPQRQSENLVGLGALLLNRQGTPDETYFFIKCGRIYSHFHGDEGAFMLNVRGAPLMDEYGVQYASTTNEQRRHNIVAFEGREVYNRGTITTFRSFNHADYLIAEMPIHVLYCPPGLHLWGFKGEEGPYGWWRRHILFSKATDRFFLYDQIESPYPTALHMHCKADSYSREPMNRFDFIGRFGVDMSLMMMSERELAAEMVEFCPKERVPGQPHDEGWFKQWSVNVSGAPGEDFASLIVPFMPGDKPSIERRHKRNVVDVTTTDGARETLILGPMMTAYRNSDVSYHGRAGLVLQHSDGRTDLVQMAGRMIGAKGVEIVGDGPFHASINAGRVRVLTTDPSKPVRVTAPGRSVHVEPAPPAQSLR